MKICSSCGASLPDQATFCVACGSTNIRSESSSQNYQYDNGYGNGQYQQQYDDGQYQQYDDGYDNGQYAQQYDDGYDNGRYAQQYDDGYGNDQYQQQYDDGYDNGQYQQQYDDGYDNGQYQQQYDDGYDNGQYDQQYDDGQYQQQYDNGYDNGQYQQQYDDYDNGQYDQQYDEEYDNGYNETSQYQNETPQPQQPVQQSEPDIIAQIKAKERKAAANGADSDDEEPEESHEDLLEKIKQQEQKNPYENSKDFKFEKKEKTEEEEPGPKPKPTDLKGYIEMFRDTKEYSVKYDRADLEKNKNICIAACLGITFWVPMAFRGNSRVGRFYANQGLLILIVSVVSSILYALFSGIIGVACTTYTVVDYIYTVPTLSVGGIILDILFFALCYSIPIFLFICAFDDIRKGKIRDIPFIGKLHLLHMY